MSDKPPNSQVIDESASTDRQPWGQGYVVRYRRRAMACTFEALIPADSGAAGETAIECLDEIEELERLLTVYRDDSDVSRINRLGFATPQEVDPRVLALLKDAAYLSRDTLGAFDPTSGPLIKAWGFHQRRGRVPTDEEREAALARVGMRHVSFEPGGVRLLREGVELNLGAIGKGFAIDRATERMTRAGLDRFAWIAGQSSLRCVGDEFADRPGEGWQVSVGHPLHLGRSLGALRLKGAALSTTGGGVQFFRAGDRRFGHVLDPRTGWPAEGVLSVTAVAPSASWAEALSTAFFVLGPDLGEEYCQRNSAVGALWSLPGAKTGQVLVRSCGLERADWSQLES